MSKIISNVGAAPMASRQLAEYAESMSGPHVGWDPIAFQKIGGFGGGIRSTSGAFRDRDAFDAAEMMQSVVQGSFAVVEMECWRASTGNVRAREKLGSFLRVFSRYYHHDANMIRSLAVWLERLHEGDCAFESCLDVDVVERFVEGILQGETAEADECVLRASRGDVNALQHIYAVVRILAERLEKDVSTNPSIESWVCSEGVMSLFTRESDEFFVESDDWLAEFYGSLGIVAIEDDRALNIVRRLAMMGNDDCGIIMEEVFGVVDLEMIRDKRFADAVFKDVAHCFISPVETQRLSEEEIDMLDRAALQAIRRFTKKSDSGIQTPAIVDSEEIPDGGNE